VVLKQGENLEAEAKARAMGPRLNARALTRGQNFAFKDLTSLHRRLWSETQLDMKARASVKEMHQLTGHIFFIKAKMHQLF